MRINNKKATTLISDNTLSFMMGVVGVSVLIALLVLLIFPFDKNKETTKAYFSMLEKAVNDADSGEIGKFLMYADAEGENDLELVYFASDSAAKIGGVRFTVDNRYKNYICICRKGTAIEAIDCDTKFCMSLKEEAVLKSGEDILVDSEGKWGVGIKTRVDILKESGGYVFLQT